MSIIALSSLVVPGTGLPMAKNALSAVAETSSATACSIGALRCVRNAATSTSVFERLSFVATSVATLSLAESPSSSPLRKMYRLALMTGALATYMR